MTDETQIARFNQMAAMAERIAARCEIKEPIFSGLNPDYYYPYAANSIAAITEGRLPWGQIYATWIPVKTAQYERDLDGVKRMSEMVWRGKVMGELFKSDLLMGRPKGKLPT